MPPIPIHFVFILWFFTCDTPAPAGPRSFDALRNTTPGYSRSFASIRGSINPMKQSAAATENA